MIFALLADGTWILGGYVVGVMHIGERCLIILQVALL